MKVLTFIVSQILIVAAISAQNTFVKSIAWYEHAIANGIERTGTNGYAVIGYKTDSNPIDHDGFLAKIDLNGDTVWTTYFGNSSMESPEDLIRTRDGGFAITGTCIPSAQSGSAVMLIKLDSNGIIEWSRAYGGLSSSSYPDLGRKVIQTQDGGFMIAGITMEFGPYPGDSDIYLLRIDAQGNLVWTRAYGAQYHDEPTGLDSTLDGGFIISGRTDSYSTSTLQNDAFLMRVDSVGNIVWYKRYGGTGHEFGKCVHALQNGDFMLVGDETSYHTTPGSGAFVMRVNSSGNVIWAKSYAQANKNVFIFSSAITTDNKIIATGSFQNWSGGTNVLNFYIDSAGTVLWQKHSGGNFNDGGYDVAIAPDSGFVFAGYTSGLTGLGYSQALILKSDLSGDHGCYDSLCNLTVTNANVIPIAITVQQYTGGTGDTVTYPQTAGMGKYEYCENSIGIAEVSAPIINAYPNPANTNVFVSIDPNANGHYLLYSLDGQLVSQSHFAGPFEIDLSQYTSGIYFLRCVTREESYTLRIIKAGDQ